MASLEALTQDTLIATENAAEANYERNQNPRQGYRLKASDIADDCERKLWATFRWMAEPKPATAKMIRIFDNGNIIEKRFINDFKATPGLMVKDCEFDEDGQPTDKQIGTAFADGHGYGYVDCLLYGLPEAPKTVHVCEIKSMKNTDYNATVKHGVQKQKPLHYGQFQMYMHKLNYERALYAFECKNTSERGFQRLDYDFEYGTRLEAKATRIAFAEHAPVRAYEDETHFGCMFCEHKGWCWEKSIDLPKRTCRTCAHVTPLSGGKWACAHNSGKWLSREEQETGCTSHLYNPDMVNGEITGGDGEKLVIYRMIDGTQFIDAVGGEEDAA